MIVLAAAMPPIPGITTSISTSCGASVCTARVASSPEDASPTSANPSAQAISSRSAPLNRSWSSTSSTVTWASAPGAEGEGSACIGAESRTGADRSQVCAQASALRAGPPSRSCRSTGLGQVDQRRLDAAADVLVLGQAELGEDRVHVLLDRPLGQHQRLRDRPVALAG